MFFFGQLPIEKVEFLYYFLDIEHKFFYAPDLSMWGANHQVFHSSIRTEDIQKFHQFTLQHPPTKIFMRTRGEVHLHGVHWNQNESNIDLTAHGVNKGSACCELIKLLDINPAEVAFVFNDKNDLPVIMHSELQDIITIKVGDFLPLVKSKYSVASPYEVSEILSKLI